jgi:hypothetical protein
MSVKPNGLLMFGIVFRNKVSDRVKQRARSKTLQVLDNPRRVLFCNRVECRREKELNDLQRIPLDIEILSNLRFGSLEIRDTSVTRVTNNFSF